MVHQLSPRNNQQGERTTTRSLPEFEDTTLTLWDHARWTTPTRYYQQKQVKLHITIIIIDFIIIIIVVIIVYCKVVFVYNRL